MNMHNLILHVKTPWQNSHIVLHCIFVYVYILIDGWYVLFLYMHFTAVSQAQCIYTIRDFHWSLHLNKHINWYYIPTGTITLTAGKAGAMAFDKWGSDKRGLPFLLLLWTVRAGPLLTDCSHVSARSPNLVMLSQLCEWHLINQLVVMHIKSNHNYSSPIAVPIHSVCAL